ncbi:anion exchange protein 2 [Ostrinia furnacalis]|uniref:anion exchange protein 2 n=1 Tax=Ostrinia furnacalis TaxID=93504 RepID=UPI00103D4C52|nr:anion exchange protein 2 [Ostrinia furnacalis]
MDRVWRDPTPGPSFLPALRPSGEPLRDIAAPRPIRGPGVSASASDLSPFDVPDNDLLEQTQPLMGSSASWGSHTHLDRGQRPPPREDSRRTVQFGRDEGSDGDDAEAREFRRSQRHLHYKSRKYSLQEGGRVAGGMSGSGERRVSVAPGEEPLPEVDLDELASHRTDDPHVGRHKTDKPSSVHLGRKEAGDKLQNVLPEGTYKKMYDHSPHAVFVQLDELLCNPEGESEWQERARWIKYEEDREEGSDRWGKPHVASLSFHSLLNLRRCLETGVVLLDLDEKDLPGVAYRVVENMVESQLIEEDDKPVVMRSLLLRHRHVHEDKGFRFSIGGRKHASYTSLQSLWVEEPGIPRARCSLCSATGLCRRHSAHLINLSDQRRRRSSHALPMDRSERKKSSSAAIDMKEVEYLASTIVDGSQDELRKGHNESIMKRIPEDAEATTVLVGAVGFLEQPTIAFVRLAHGIQMSSITEVPIPVRFMFILLGPSDADLDYHEVGRSISTLMSNPAFHSIAYKADDRRELLSGINEFLDDSIVLPPGDWERQALLPIEELRAKSEMIRRRKRDAIEKKARKEKAAVAETTPSDEKKALLEAEKGSPPPKEPDDPLSRTGRLFGGVIRDIKRRYPFYMSDFTDALNGQCAAATIFMYFAALSSAITFGGLLAEKTHGQIGISETLVRFTEDIFAFLISLIFIGEPITNIISVYRNHPLGVDYCAFQNQTHNSTMPDVNGTGILDNSTVTVTPQLPILPKPNTALFCTILTLSTFIIAYYLRIFRNGKFLGRSARRALGDFGVPIAIVLMVGISRLVPVWTETLRVPEGLSPTADRSWLVPANPGLETIPFWAMLVMALPALMVYIIVFMETHIAELIVDKPERRLKKGSGFHMDIVIMSLVNGVCGMFGAPWQCVATVRSVSHVSALTVMSTTHAPGDKPHIVEVKEQRLTGLLVSILCGVSVLAAGWLRLVPMAVLFGVFLYMGISALGGIQFWDRCILLLKPVKHHPQVPYVRRVPTLKMHMYTLIQLAGICVLYTVKSSRFSLALPFFLVLMVPLRMALVYLFTPLQLRALDGAQKDIDKDDEPDFYEEAPLP